MPILDKVSVFSNFTCESGTHFYAMKGTAEEKKIESTLPMAIFALTNFLTPILKVLSFFGRAFNNLENYRF